MRLRKAILVQFAIFMITLLIFNPGFSQVKREQTIPFSGFIKSIPKDFKYVILKNTEIEIFILSDTKIVDEKGNALKIDELKPGLYVIIESFQKQDAFFAKKIIVKPFQGV
jgi:hypothetical protein